MSSAVFLYLPQQSQDFFAEQSKASLCRTSSSTGLHPQHQAAPHASPPRDTLPSLPYLSSSLLQIAPSPCPSAEASPTSPARSWAASIPSCLAPRPAMGGRFPGDAVTPPRDALQPPEHPASTGYPARIPSQLTALGLLLLGTWGQKGVRYRGF